MGKFDGILFCSDLDGTLLKADKSISEENICAIEYFKANGGMFTIMTGRMSYSVGSIINTINPNVPIGFGNGLGIFDFKTNEKSYLAHVDSSVLGIIRYIYDNFPEIGIEITTHDCIYTARSNDMVEKHFNDEGHKLIMTEIGGFPHPIAKILFAAKETILDDFISKIESHHLANKFQLLRSDKIYYEILPKNVGKGELLKNLTSLLGSKVKKTIAIGDNDNDIGMIQCADIGIAVANAVDRVKISSDIITVSNEDDAIAKVIYDLDKIIK